MKTRWFRFWNGGEVGHGASETLYQSYDRNVTYSGYERLDFPLSGGTWALLEVGQTLKTISGAIVERIQ